jgi:hypothetical protein
MKALSSSSRRNGLLSERRRPTTFNSGGEFSFESSVTCKAYSLT